MNKKNIFIIIISGLIIISGGLFLLINNEKNTITDDNSSKYLGKKVFYANSYHRGFEWSDGEQKGFENFLTKKGVEFKSIYMDTKNNPSEDFGKNAALILKNQIEQYKPDVLVVTDDAAFKYLVSVYYKDSDLPVVFGGINWDLSAYGGKYKNTTGMVEIALYKDIVYRLTEYAKGSRVGFLTGDNISEYKNADFIKKNIDPSAKIVFVKDFDNWKKEFINIQKDVDILIIGISGGITDWDNIEAEKFVLENTKIPTGTEQEWMMPFSMIGYTKDAQEQGEAAARIAIEILDGKKPSDIDIIENKKGNLFLNLKIANKLNIKVSQDLLRNSVIIN